MSRSIVLLICVICATALPLAAQPTPAQLSGLVTLAQQFVDLLAKEDFTAAAGRFDEASRQQAPPERLGESWRTLVTNFGAFRQRLQAFPIQIVGPFVAVIIGTEFDRAFIDFTVQFEHSQIVGYGVNRNQRSFTEFGAPPYADPGRFDERTVAVGTGEWVLPGTLSVPSDGGPHPALVLVHGSGALDRDETIAANKPFRDIAWGLASRGIAVLRYEKRTRAYGARVAQMFESFTVNQETVDDAVAAVALLRTTAAVDLRRIFVLGHSLGGFLVPRIGKRDGTIAGLIVLGGPSRPLEDAVMAQAMYQLSLHGTINPAGQRFLDALNEQIARVRDPSLSPSVSRLLLPGNLPARYWLDIRGYNPAVEAKDLNRPLLVLHGRRDFQVYIEDFEGWQKTFEGRQGAMFKLYPAANHLLIDGEGLSTRAEYERPGHVGQTVIEDIAAWIMGRR